MLAKADGADGEASSEGEGGDGDGEGVAGAVPGRSRFLLARARSSLPPPPARQPVDEAKETADGAGESEPALKWEAGAVWKCGIETTGVGRMVGGGILLPRTVCIRVRCSSEDDIFCPSYCRAIHSLCVAIRLFLFYFFYFTFFFFFTFSPPERARHQTSPVLRCTSSNEAELLFASVVAAGTS